MKTYFGRLLFLGLLSISASAYADPAAQHLNSGKSVNIIAIDPISFSEGKSGLILQYQTKLPMDDFASLRKEADEIWEHLVVDVEHRGLESAIISANTDPKGLIVKTSTSYNFAYVKMNGNWHSPEAEKPIKLDKDYVTAFMKRMDFYYNNNELNAMLLYLADDWAVTITDPNSKAAPVKLNRIQFAAGTHETLAKTKDYHHTREILNIKISGDGTTAEVESRETETGSIQGKPLALHEHTVDQLQLKNSVLWDNKSNVTLE